MYYVEQSGSFEAIFESGISGAVGTLAVQIVDNVGGVVSGPSTLGIIEYPPGSGFYQASLTAPGTIGQYGIAWSLDGSFDETQISVDDLTVVPAGAGDALPPISPIGPGPGPVPGPCNAWVTEEQVAACCSVDVGSDFDLFTDVANAASRLLWELSGRLYSGTCDRVVRPCSSRDCAGWQILSRGHIVWSGLAWQYSDYWDEGTPCGCQALSRIKLSGYPVREVVEVKIDGDVVDPDTYRLDEWHYLTRKNDLLWPGCQDLSRDDTEIGTFSVRYTYGQNPPPVGQDAAAQLACEMYKSCSGNSTGDCALPTGATRITRQGVVIEKLSFVSWGFNTGLRGTRAPGWNTGLTFVDAFLNAYNPNAVKRRPAFWGPSARLRYARPVGS